MKRKTGGRGTKEASAKDGEAATGEGSGGGEGVAAGSSRERGQGRRGSSRTRLDGVKNVGWLGSRSTDAKREMMQKSVVSVVSSVASYDAEH